VNVTGITQNQSGHLSSIRSTIALAITAVSETMKRSILVALVFVVFARSAFAQDAPNAARRIEISYTGNLRYFLGLGFVRKGGSNLGGACVQVSVSVTHDAAVVGEV